MGHFVLSHKEKTNEREGQGRNRNRNVSEKAEEIKPSSSTLTCYKALPNCKPISVGRPGHLGYTTSSPHPTTSLPACRANTVREKERTVDRLFFPKLCYIFVIQYKESFIHSNNNGEINI